MRETALAGTVGQSLDPDTLLAVRDLHTHFFTDAGQVRAVSGVSFTLRQGETLAIVGESGSGKSVTGLSIMQLLGRTGGRVVAGAIMLRARDGRVVELLGLDERGMQAVRGPEIAMIFQDPMSSLNPVFTVGEQIAESIRVHNGTGRREAWREAVRLLTEVGISDPEQRASAFPHQLSGGMRQRALIAMALACNPHLLIADEPTTALDVTIQAQIVTLLKRLQAERGMAMIFVTHDLKLVSEVADRVAVMYASEIVEEGRVADVIDRPRHPYTRALMDCIPRREYGAGGPQALRPIPGMLPDPLQDLEGCRFHARCSFAAPECSAARPPLEPLTGDHAVRCIRHGEIGL